MATSASVQPKELSDDDINEGLAEVVKYALVQMLTHPPYEPIQRWKETMALKVIKTLFQDLPLFHQEQILEVIRWVINTPQAYNSFEIHQVLVVPRARDILADLKTLKHTLK